MLNKIRGWWTRNKYPSEGWLETANEEASHTPDLLALEERAMHLLFLPCELQEKHAEGRRFFSSGVPLYKAFTKQNYSLYRDREEGIGILLDKPLYPVKGELWIMLSSSYSLLDKYKDNGVKSSRRRIEVCVPFSRKVQGGHGSKVTSEVVNLPAWAYVGSPDYWENELDNGFRYPQVRLYRPNNPFLKPFHYYHLNEYKK